MNIKYILIVGLLNMVYINTSSCYYPKDSKCNDIKFIDYNTSIGDPDTSLLIFFWRDSLIYDFDASIVEEYTRLEVERENFNQLLYRIFGNCPEYDFKKAKIDSLSISYRKYLYTYVEKEAQANGGLIESIEFDYFYQTRYKDLCYNSLVAKFGFAK